MFSKSNSTGVYPFSLIFILVCITQPSQAGFFSWLKNILQEEVLETKNKEENSPLFLDNYDIEKKTSDLVLCNPIVTAFAIQPSCINGIPNSDGYLQISKVDAGTHYNYSVGSIYIGSTVYSDGTAFNPSTDLPLQFGSFSNPTGSQDYTIRIFNGASNCFTDVVVTMNEQDCTIGCDCTEYVYLNDTGGKKVHKFKINSDSTLTEVLNNGMSWYPGANSSELPSPHGIAMDPNGLLYIAEKKSGDIRKLTCNGNLFPTTDFEAVGYGGTNFGTIDNILFVNDTDNEIELEAIDLCTGGAIGSICFNSTSSIPKNWGYYLDPRTKVIYYTLFENSKGGEIFKATLDDLNSGSCVTPYLLRGTKDPVIGDNFLPNTSSPFGLTTDEDENVYIVMKKKFSSSEVQIYKYSPLGILLARSILDSDALDGTIGKFSRALGIVYSEIEDVLYVSVNTNDEDEDCIAIFETTSSATDTILTYISTGFPNPPTGSGTNQTGKGIGINKECCPTNNNITIDTSLCMASIGDNFFLQELINCSGIICEGLWKEGDNNTGITYNNCNNSITFNALSACGSFTLNSDGTGNNPQCGAFKITVNICSDCYDWGDLPDPAAGTAMLDYETDTLNNGPNHFLVKGLFLGSQVDEENNGQPSNDALGDGIDEDGISFPSNMQVAPGGTLNIPFSATNTTGNTAHFEMWIDWNGDGDFADAGEMVSNIDDTTPFPNYLPITMPINAVQGQDIGVRLRLSNTDDMTPYGPIGSGEVEDYLIEIACSSNECLTIQSISN